MDTQFNIAEAKAKLSELVNAAASGQEITIARAGKPAAKLIPFSEPSARELGFFPIEVPDELFDPLDDESLLDWE